MKLLVLALTGSVLAAGGSQPATVDVTATARPATVRVGDSIRYVVRARLGTAGVVASTVRVFADTGPLARIGPTTTTRTTQGSILVVTLEQELACLDLDCAPTDEARRILLPAARVTAQKVAGGLLAATAAPVGFAVLPRVSGADVRAAPPPYRQQTALPPRGRGAGRLATALAASTVALAALALGLAIAALRRRTAPRPTERELTRAIRLLRESATRTAPDRRRAAGLLARLVGSTGAPSVAADAAELAWSPPAPEPESAVALAERAERTST
jgi:hypothetical protein